MARFCASCGTEVDDTAVFCPTCGQPIDDDEAAEMPAAPAWPDPAADDRPRDAPDAGDERGMADAPTRVERRPPPDDGPENATPATESAHERPDLDRRERERRGPERRERQGRGAPRFNLPITAPVTLSAWLIGGGALLAAIGILVVLVVGLLNVIDLLMLLGLLAIAATIFFSANVPAIPHVRLATLVVVLVAFGVALDRVGFRGAGAGELLLFLGTGAAAIGAVLLEAGWDQPLGRPS